jgi:ABC-type transport system substrate-binding protein
MQKFLGFLLAVIMVFSFAGCNSQVQNSTSNPPASDSTASPANEESGEPLTLRIGAFWDFKYPTQEATLVKNNEYWNSEKLSDVDIVKWLVIPDQDARMTALESGQVDVVGYSEMGRTIPASSVGMFETKDGYKVIREDKDAYSGVYSVTANYLSEPMSDVYLRQSIAYAIDRDLLVETVFLGEAIATPYMMNPAFIGGSSKVEPYTANIEKAKRY